MDVTLGESVWHSEGFSQFCIILNDLEFQNMGAKEDFLIPAWAK